jgi:hypothetical protein
MLCLMSMYLFNKISNACNELPFLAYCTHNLFDLGKPGDTENIQIFTTSSLPTGVQRQAIFDKTGILINYMTH